MPTPPGRLLLVTLGRARGSLAAARALYRAGWTVGVGTPDGHGMVAASRACAAHHRVPRPRGDGEHFVAGVRRAVAEGGYDLVLGGADDWMAALATYRDRLPVPVAHPPAAVVDAALDKVGLADRAATVGLAPPRTAPATERAVGCWRGPVVVKCRAHWFPGQQRGPRIEAQVFPDVATAREQLDLLRREGFEPVLQEPVDGRLTAVIGLFHHGRLRGRTQQVTHRTWPSPSGVSSRASTVALDEDLAERCERLLQELGWQGLVELQFLQGPDGRPRLIDLNGRFYGSLALATAAGPNLPDAWARQALGLDLPPLPDATPGVRYLWAAGDVRRALRERRGGLIADVSSTLRWARGATTSVWDRHDVGPTLHLLTARGRRMLRAPA